MRYYIVILFIISSSCLKIEDSDKSQICGKWSVVIKNGNSYNTEIFDSISDFTQTSGKAWISGKDTLIHAEYIKPYRIQCKNFNP